MDQLRLESGNWDHYSSSKAGGLTLSSSRERRRSCSGLSDHMTTIRSTNPILICRKGRELDGQEPSGEELRALELALSFAFLDCNPREYTEHEQSGWGIVTTDNMELYLWPIDLQEGCVMLTTGYLVTSRILN